MRSHLSHVFFTFGLGVGFADALKVQSSALRIEAHGMVIDDAFLAQVRALNTEQTMFNPNAVTGDDDSDDSLTKAEIDAEIQEEGCGKISTSAWNST